MTLEQRIEKEAKNTVLELQGGSQNPRRLAEIIKHRMLDIASLTFEMVKDGSFDHLLKKVKKK